MFCCHGREWLGSKLVLRAVYHVRHWNRFSKLPLVLRRPFGFWLALPLEAPLFPTSLRLLWWLPLRKLVGSLITGAIVFGVAKPSH